MNKIKFQIFITIKLFLFSIIGFCQTPEFTHQDTLRGTITQERMWWDLTYYHLKLRVNPTDSTLTGENTIEYRVLKTHQLMQIDLQPPMQITKIYQEDAAISFKRDGNAYFIELLKRQIPGNINEIVIFFLVSS